MVNSLNLNYLQSFMKLGETGSFSQAASQLGITKAKMSRHIARLEADLSQNLVYRTTRQVQLTAAGRKLYESVRASMDHLDSAVTGVRQEAETLSGTLRVTAPEDFGVFLLTDLICEFGGLHPHVRFELMYSERVLDIVRDSIDVALRVGSLSMQSLRARRLGTIEMVLVASPRYLESRANPLTLANLNEAPFIVHGSGCTEMILRLFRGSRSLELVLTPTIVSRSMMALHELAFFHRGVALLPKFLAEGALSSGRLVTVCPGWKPSGYPLCVATLAKRGTDPLIRRFVDFLSDRLPARLGLEN